MLLFFDNSLLPLEPTVPMVKVEKSSGFDSELAQRWIHPYIYTRSGKPAEPCL